VGEPVGKTVARQAEYRIAASSQARGQAARFPGYAVILPANAQIESQVSSNLPIVLREKRHFILTKIADALRRRLVILECVQLGRGVHIHQLRYAAQRAREVTQQIAHSLVVARRVRSSKTRHIRAADGVLGYR